jgi:hypothetical protein
MNVMKAMNRPMARTNPVIGLASYASLRTPRIGLQLPNPTFLGFVFDHRSDAGAYGDLARAIAKDPCFPKDPEASYVACVEHVNEVHAGKADVLAVLDEMLRAWMDAWAATGTHPSGPPPGRRRQFPPRQDIFAAAAESGLSVNRNGMAFCWNDSGPTSGHNGGNKDRSMKLYGHNQTFFCHQCGIWGFSDQLKIRTWQGRAR